MSESATTKRTRSNLDQYKTRMIGTVKLYLDQEEELDRPDPTEVKGAGGTDASALKTAFRKQQKGSNSLTDKST